MTNEEIINKAIDKAVGNGWEKPENMVFFTEEGAEWTFNGSPAYFSIIFSHPFAEAFWHGKGERGEMAVEAILGKDGKFVESWKVYLQRMVLEEEPLKYLEKFL